MISYQNEIEPWGEQSCLSGSLRIEQSFHFLGQRR